MAEINEVEIGGEVFTVEAKEAMASVEAEAKARAEADNALGERITNETIARENADNALGERITNETTARENATTSLGGRIDNEAKVRAEADNVIINGTTPVQKVAKGATMENVKLAVVSQLNKIGTGRNLLALLGVSDIKEMSKKLKSMNPRDNILQPGDYFSFNELTTPTLGTLKNASENLRYEYAGNHYDGVGDIDSGPGFLFVAKNVNFKRYMNETNTNEGGYNNCQLKTLLNTEYAEAIEKALGVELKLVHRLVDTHGGWAWTAEKCFLPTEVEIFGYQAWGRGGYYSGTSVQYPIYAIDPARRIKHYNGSRWWYWEGTSDSVSSTYFCHCNSIGYASHHSASHGDSGVAPAFYL